MFLRAGLQYPCCSGLATNLSATDSRTLPRLEFLSSELVGLLKCTCNIIPDRDNYLMSNFCEDDGKPSWKNVPQPVHPERSVPTVFLQLALWVKMRRP